MGFAESFLNHKTSVTLSWLLCPVRLQGRSTELLDTEETVTEESEMKWFFLNYLSSLIYKFILWLNSSLFEEKLY